MTAAVFHEFLKQLMIEAGKPVFVVVDGHPIHKAKLIRKYVEWKVSLSCSICHRTHHR